MGTVSLVVRIDSVAFPAGHPGVDAEELRRRVELELADLLAREPLRVVPSTGGRIEAAGGRVHAASASTAASLARAIARRVHTGLQTGSVRR
jgi:hypothetical protein